MRTDLRPLLSCGGGRERVFRDRVPSGMRAGAGKLHGFDLFLVMAASVGATNSLSEKAKTAGARPSIKLGKRPRIPGYS